jgi:hypothetical protein
MTNQHPITPPPELVQQWYNAIDDSSTSWNRQLIIRAAQWAADQELEACCEWLEQNQGRWEIPMALRDARRPKPPSLKKHALSEVAAAVAGGNITPERGAIIRVALEALPE